MIAFITGSGFYEYRDFEKKTSNTPHGEVTYYLGKVDDKEVVILPRHGAEHKFLPHHINSKANIFALKDMGVDTVVSFSVMGIVDKQIPLGVPVIMNDIYYAENRCPNGQMCTFFETPGEAGRGHLIGGSFFHSGLQTDLGKVLKEYHPVVNGNYAHVNGPRFNSKLEIKALQGLGVHLISQTCGPEAVLANELEMSYGLVGIGIDFANGVQKLPTPMGELDKNLETSMEVFENIIENLPKVASKYDFENCIYRFQ